MWLERHLNIAAILYGAGMRPETGFGLHYKLDFYTFRDLTLTVSKPFGPQFLCLKYPY